jgi:hypothetical protein
MTEITIDPATGLPIFKPDGEVLRTFMLDKTSRAKVIQGPIGSGKTLGSMMCIWGTALEQKAQRDGIRRCRAHVFRDTYQKLKDTTLKSWIEWFPERLFGKFYWSPPLRHEIRCGDVELDVHFVALEDEWESDYFRSLETTICYFNELQYLPKLLWDEAVTRVGRYPRVIDGGAVNPQVIGDMNAPDDFHWVPIMRGDVAVPDFFSADQRRAHLKPDGWSFYVQPPGLLEIKDREGEVARYEGNPKAENLKYLPVAYYENAISGKSKSWIDANVLNRVSPRRDGKPVVKDFSRTIHVARNRIEPTWGLDLQVGIDFGRQPCAIFGQCLRGQWTIVDELITHDIGTNQFAPMLRNVLQQKFPGFPFRLWGDPSGDFKGQNDDNTPFQILRGHKLAILPAPSFLFTVRLQAIEAVLTRMSEGRPALQISPNCTTLIAALDGGWHYRRLKVQGEKYGEEPEKDQYSHPADAFGYMVLGGGEGRMLLTGGIHSVSKIINTRKEYDPFRPTGSTRRGW